MNNDLFREMSVTDPPSRLHVAYVDGEKNLFTKIEVTIDAPLEEVAAFNFIEDSRRQMSGADDDVTIVYKDSVSINNHACESVVIRDYGFKGRKARMFVSKKIFKRRDENTIVIVSGDWRGESER